MALTQQQLLDLVSAFGPSILSGIGQAGQAGADRAALEREQQRQQEQEQYNRRLAARGALAGFYQNQQTRDINAATGLADQSPLGAEQVFAQQMARRRMAPALAAQFGNQAGSNPMATAALRGGPNFLAPFAGEDYQSTVSQGATARSIAERRKALAGVDPNFQFGSMGDYGLPDLGGEVSQYQGDVRSRRQASELELQRLLTEQMREASAAQLPTTTATGQAPAASTSKKGPSLLRRIAGAALPVAAAFIPGVGPVASALIQAGAGAAGSALAGGGVKGALTGAALGGLGAATGGLGSAAGRQVAGESAKSFVKRAILNPRALTQIAGGVAGGEAGAAAQLASLGMDRIPGGVTAQSTGMVDAQGRLRQIDPALLNRPLESLDASLSRTPGMSIGGVLQPDADSAIPARQNTALAELAASPRPRPVASRARGAATAAAAPQGPLPLELQRALEQLMTRSELQQLPAGTLTDAGTQEAFGPAAGAYRMFGGPEGRPGAAKILGDLTGAGMLAALGAGLLPRAAAGLGAAALGATEAGAAGSAVPAAISGSASRAVPATLNAVTRAVRGGKSAASAGGALQPSARAAQFKAMMDQLLNRYSRALPPGGSIQRRLP